MNDTRQNSESPSKNKDDESNFLIINSFSKNVLGLNKKYMTNRKIGLAKNSFLKNGQTVDGSIVHYETNKSASVVNLEFEEGNSS